MIEFTNDNGTTTIISEVEPEHQCKLLQLIGLSFKKTKTIQYEFTEALEAFTILSPEDKRKEIYSWIEVMEGILDGKECKENKEVKVRNIY